jgi:hypothetical protein
MVQEYKNQGNVIHGPAGLLLTALCSLFENMFFLAYDE